MESSTAPPSGTVPPTGDTAEAPKPKRAPSPDSGKYVVLAAAPVDGIEVVDGMAVDPVQLGNLRFAIVWGPQEAEGGKAAKDAALRSKPELAAQVDPGADGVWLIAVPASSCKPKLAKQEQPPPVLRGL